MKARVAKKKATKTVEKKDIPQLSGSKIIQIRVSKCVRDLGEFKPEEICKKCRFCKYYPIAKTPMDSKYRQMDAWDSYVAEHIPCDCINGVENEETGEIEVLRGNQEACENFKLAMERVPQELKDIINKNRKLDASHSASDLCMKQVREENAENLKKVNLEIEQLKIQMNELKAKKEGIEEELVEAYLSRFRDIDEINDKNAQVFARIVGEETLEEDNEREEADSKLRALGFEPNQKKAQKFVVQVSDIERIQAKSTDNTYGGLFKKTNEKGLKIDDAGNTLASYAGQTFIFETELVEVAKSKGFRKQVIFQETDENFEKRKNISILTLLCGDRKMRWREDVVVEPKIENLEEPETDVADDEEEVSEGE